MFGASGEGEALWGLTPEKEAVLATKSLYVGNLPYSMTESSLRELFADFEPTAARVIGDKGFGFVDLPEERAADAIAALNGREIDGRAIVVNEARPRTERGGGGGRGGFGRGGGGRGGGGGGFGGSRRRW
jgi:RNA recognition motif-containing protein